MNIGIINTSQPYTGIGNYSFSLYKRLRNNTNIEHIFFDNKKYTINNLTLNKKIAEINRLPYIDNSPLFYYRAQKNIPVYDLYHLTNQNISFFDVHPKIITCHDIIHDVYPVSKMHLLISKWMYNGLKDAAHIITDSDATAFDLQQKYNIPKDKMTTVHLGIDHDLFKPDNDTSSIYSRYNLSSDNEYIFHISSEQPRKNVDAIIKAFYRLKKQNPNKNLVLLKAGRAQYKKDRGRLTKLIKSLNLQNDIKFLDKVSNEDLVKLYSISKVFVFPSFYEGFGLPVVEAMACGTPVIASCVSSLPEVVGDAGMAVNPSSNKQIADAISKLITDEDLRRSYIKKGFVQASKFTWNKCANSTSKIYKEVLNNI